MEIYIPAIIAYALMESSNAIDVYWGDKNNRRNLIIVVTWASLIMLCSLAEIFALSTIIKNVLHILFSISWFPLISTPCTLRLYRKNKTTKIIRKIIFIIVGLYQFIYVIMNYF